MPSSANNGYLSLNHSNPMPLVMRYNNKTDGEIYGVTEYYNYRALQSMNISTFPVGRFANEFGFHSMPSLASWREVVPEEDLRLDSEAVLYRNHHYPPAGLDMNFANTTLGMEEMTNATAFWLPYVNKTDPIANFSAWCHSTQVFQAAFVKSQIQFYRIGSGRPEHQLGVLYWQLEDIWQAPTWAGIEYNGRWKVMHNVAKDILQSIIVAPLWDLATGLVQIYAVSDLWTPVHGQVSLTWVDWNGNPMNVTTGSADSAVTSTPSPDGMGTALKFSIGPLNSTLLTSFNVTELNATNALDPKAGLLVAELTATGNPINSEATKTYTHTNYFTPTPLSRANLVDPGVSVRFEPRRNVFEVTAATGTSIWTWLSLDDKDDSIIILFDENGFLLQKGETKQVSYSVLSGMSYGWESRVLVKSIWNNTLPI
jgi:beta-mannosidase